MTTCSVSDSRGLIMNVIKFSVEVEFKRRWRKRFNKTPWEPRDIKEHIVACLQGSVSKPDTHIAEIKQAWDNLGGRNLKGLFSSKYVVTKIAPQNITCFLFHEEPEGTRNKDRITLVALIISDLRDFDHCSTVVLKEFLRLLPKCKVGVLERNGAYLYLYDKKGGDILGDDYKVSAEFTQTALSTGEKWRIVGYTITLMVFLLLYFFGNASEPTKNIFIGVFTSCFVFLIAEVVFKIIVPRCVHAECPSIVINDLSRVVAEIEAPFVEENKMPHLKSPTLPQ
jgi:hypothetical protein